MNNKLYLTILIILILGCTKLSPQRNLDQIFNRFNSMHQELSSLDKSYYRYFENTCSGTDWVKFNNAENLFNAVNDWKEKRNAIIKSYSDVYFDSTSTTIREFKDKILIDKLISITTQLKEIESTVDYAFLQNPKCETVFSSPQSDYMLATKSKTCLIQCSRLKKLARSFLELSKKEYLIIQTAQHDLLIPKCDQ